MPVGFKSGIHLGHDFRHILLGYFHIPFQTIGNGRMGQVGRTHIGSGIATVPLKKIRFGMEPGFLHIIRNPHFRIGKLGKDLNGFGVCSTHIGSSQDPQMATGCSKSPQIGENQGQTRKFNKGNQKINSVAGGNFPAEF